MKSIAIVILVFMMVTSAFSLFTPFPPSNPVADSITAKGNLLTSDGTNQIEKVACLDGESIEYLAAAGDGTGMTCVTAGGGANDTLSNLNVTTSINSSLVPQGSGQKALGASGTRWGDTYVHSNLWVGIDSQKELRLTNTAPSPVGNTGFGLALTSDLASPLILSTANTTGFSTTSPISLETGNADQGNSGNIELTVGTSTSGVRGSISLKAEADKTLLNAQPTGLVPLAIATTQYVDDSAGGGSFANTTLSNLTGNTAISQNLYFSGYRQVGASSTPIGYLRTQAMEINTGSSPKFTIEGGSFSQDGLLYGAKFQNFSGLNVAYQSKTQNTLKSDDVYVLTGEVANSAATTLTGDIKIHTGDNKGFSHTGSLSLKSGDNAKATSGVGNSGDVIVSSGDILNAGTGTSGNVNISTGASAATRGTITLDSSIDKVLLSSQPTGANVLAVATTKYVDDNAGGGSGLIKTPTIFLGGAAGTFTKDAATTSMRVILIGGGGSGASNSACAFPNTAPSMGGNSGNLTIMYYRNPAASYNYTVGIGGAGVTGGLSGNSGTNTIWGAITTNGGVGGLIQSCGNSLLMDNDSCAGPLGGIVYPDIDTERYIYLAGESCGRFRNSEGGHAGNGGDTPFNYGRGGAGRLIISGANNFGGSAGYGYGGGGAAAVSNNGTTTSGAGAQGVIIVEEY